MTGRSSTSDAASESNTTYTSNSWSNKYITIFLSNSDSVSGIKSGYPQLWIDSGSATTVVMEIKESGYQEPNLM